MSSRYDHPMFRSMPAMAALKDHEKPTSEHLRACIMELTRQVMILHDKAYGVSEPYRFDQTHKEWVKCAAESIREHVLQSTNKEVALEEAMALVLDGVSEEIGECQRNLKP